jgi:hypothetical protein
MFSCYQDCIVSDLVKKGYYVKSPLENGDISTGSGDKAAVVLSLKIWHLDNKLAHHIYDDLIDIIRDNKILMYSVIVSGEDCYWTPSNITIEKFENNKDKLN